MIITERSWPTFAKDVSRPSDPTEYNQEAVDRLMRLMDSYVVRVKGVRPQFKSNNSVCMINFQTSEGRIFYDEAFERFKKRKAKAEAHKAQGYSSMGEMLVAMLQWRIAAESNPDRVTHIARAMYESVNKHNKAAACAFNFRISTSKVINILMNDFNVPRHKISVIWGGSSVNNSKKKKAKKAIIENDELMASLEANGINLDDLNLGEEVELQEEINFASNLRLGSQNLNQRQDEIDRYQKGISEYAFFTFKAGGVGLSLHHTDEYTDFKCRRKESGYVYEEDIIYVPTRPRELYCAPTYSAIELVQALGRCPRLTSLSDTNQFLIFFRDTIEEKVAMKTRAKLKCLSKVVRQREDWQDIISKDEATINEELFRDEKEASINADTDDDTLLINNPESED